MAASRRTFSGSDRRDLEQRQAMTPSPTAGMVRISRRRFNNSSSDDSSVDPGSLSFSSLSASVSPGTLGTQYSEPDVMINVPLDLHSREALIFLGLSDATADHIYQAWVRHNSEEFADFCTFAKDWLEARATGIDTGAAGIDWSPALRRIGAGDKLIAAITKPGFDEARLTKSAFGWVKEAMDMRWEFLLWGEAASEARAVQLGSPIEVRSGFTFQAGSGQTFRTDGTPGGETVLWKATVRTRAEGIWSNPRRQGIFNIQALASSPPTDFNGWSKRFYFTPNLIGAQYYMRYVKDIADPAGVCLVRISIPNGILEAQRPYILRFPSEDFKKTVFYSRRGESLKGRVDIVLQQALLIGDTTKGTAAPFARLNDWTEISEPHLVMLPDGSRMTQYVFAEELGDQINQHCAGRTSIVSGQDPTQQLPPLSPDRMRQG